MARSAWTLRRACSVWEGSLRVGGKADRTIATYTRAVGYLIDELGPDTAPDTITIEDLERVASKWRDLSPTTVHGRMVAWGQFFAWGERRYGWPNPTRLLDLPRKDEPSLRRLTPEEILDICRVIPLLPVRDRVIVSLFVHLGLRRGELLRLTWGSVDLRARSITLPHQITKGRKGRIVPIPHSLHATLSLATLELPEDGTATGAFVAHHVTNKAQNWLSPGFTLADYTTPAGPQTIDRLVKRAARAAGLQRPDEITSHMFRRSLLERLLEAGTSPYVAAALAGHADIKTTASYGGGASLESVRDALSRDLVGATGPNPAGGEGGIRTPAEDPPSGDRGADQPSGPLKPDQAP